MSISSRIIVRLTIATVVATAVSYGWLYLKQSYIQSHLDRSALSRQAREISHFVSIDENGSLRLDLPPELFEAYNSSKSGYHYAIRDETGRIIVMSRHGVGPLPQLTQHKSSAYEYKGAGEDAGTMGTALRTTLGQRAFITQVEKSAPQLQSLNSSVFNEFIADGGWLGIPFFFSLLAISAITIKRSLLPIEKLSKFAAKIEPGNSNVRLPQADIPREILPLVSSINGALDRLDDGFQRQREFSANAAHQLRTPLAVLAANIDMLQDTKTAAKLRYDVEQMSRIVSQLLLVARLETLNINLDEPVDLRSLVSEAAENLAPIALSMSKNLEVEKTVETVFVRGNGPIIAAAISNLIENGLNSAPAGGLVRVCVTSAPSIEVRDSGPGIPLEMREKVFERFWRGENSKGGAGLGLSIVRRIMNALNGSVSVSEAPEGGAQFSLFFPAHDMAARQTLTERIPERSPLQ